MHSWAPTALPHPPDDEEGLPRNFGRYLLFDHIGRGGMADIYLARARTELGGGGRRVVLKEILPSLSDDPAFGEMLIQEAKLAAHLSHANVVQVLDLGREGGRLFLAMQYVEGFDLNQLLRRLSKARIALPAEFAILVVREMLRALDYAHRARDDEGRPLGIVHRDVSPSNVLISFEGEVKLCDFGIARALRVGEEAPEDDEGLLRRTRVAGKSAYMAPEHARGEAIDARADLFASGILLWELCAGRRLYRGTEEEMLAQARAGSVPPLPDRGFPEAEELQRILSRALEAEREQRYLTAAGMLDELEEYAMRAGLMASQLRFGAFLTDHFAQEIIAVRREREQGAQQLLEMGMVKDSSMPPSPAPDNPGIEIETIPPAAPIPAEARAMVAAEDEDEDDSEQQAAAEGGAPSPLQPSRRLWLIAAAVSALLLLGGAVVLLSR